MRFNYLKNFYALWKRQIYLNSTYWIYQSNLERILKKGQVHMDERYEINRLEYMILDTLYKLELKDRFHSMTITELLEENEGVLGARMTVYKRLKKLVDADYIGKGIIDNHADTYFITEKGIKLIEEGAEG